MADPARARKVADRIKVLAAETIEHRIKDERLGFVTITDVRVTGDLQQASIFYTVFGSEQEREATAQALADNKGRIRSAIGSTAFPSSVYWVMNIVWSDVNIGPVTFQWKLCVVR